MIGKIKKLKNSNNEYAFPVTVSEAVYLDMKTRLSERLAQLNPTNSYLIELAKWGIHNDGTDSMDTTNGINQAILWSKSEGYNHIVLPAGTYAVKVDDKGSALCMQSGMHFEMENACILQLDSNSNPSYSIINMNLLHFAKISGGKIIGDKKTHQYQINAAGWVRGGVNADGSYNNDPNTIRSPLIDRYHDADLLANWRLWSISGVSATSYNFYQYSDTPSMDTFVNYRAGNLFCPTDSSAHGWFDVIQNCNKMLFTVDISNSPMTDAQITAISAKIDSSYYTHESGLGISIQSSNWIEVDNVEVSDCTGDGILTGIGVHYSNPAQYTQEQMGNFIWLRRCNVHHVRRNGVTLGGSNDVYFFDNFIHDVGYDDDNTTQNFFTGTAPMFGMDIESMVSAGMNIPYKFEDTGQQGLETNYRLYIYNNHFKNNCRGHFVNADGTTIIVENNTFEGYNVGGISSYDKYWHIKYLNNTFIGTLLQINGNNVVNGAEFTNGGTLNFQLMEGAHVSNVKIKDGSVTGSNVYGYFGAASSVDVAAGRFTFNTAHNMGNGARICFEQWTGKVPAGINVDTLYYTVNVTTYSFQVATAPGGLPVTLTDAGSNYNISRYNYGRFYLENLVIERDWRPDNSLTANFSLLMAGGVLKNITIKNYDLQLLVPANYVGQPVLIDGLTVIEGGGRAEGCHLTNSKFIMRNGTVGGGLSLGSNDPAHFTRKVHFDNCLFENIGVNFEGNVLCTGCTFLGCSIGKSNNAQISTITHAYLENTSLNFHWLNYPNSITISNSIFNHVIADTNASTVLINNTNISGSSGGIGNKTALLSATPAAGWWSQGDIVYNSAPTAGGYVGWSCLAAGYASDQTWTASKAYTKGSRIQAGGHVYEAVADGASGTSAPIFPTASGAAVTDHTVTWKEIGPVAAFKPFGAIQA